MSFIGLPPGLFENITAEIIGLFFTFYLDASLFSFEDQSGGDNITRVVGSSVTGASIANESILGLMEEDRVTIILLLTNVRVQVKTHCQEV